MSTIVQVNFEPKSDILEYQTRDFTLATPALADPDNALVLIDGEWMTLNTDYQLVRAADVASAGNEATSRALFPLWSERGRYDVQALRKASVVFLGDYEADTRVFDATAAVGSGAAITTVGQVLKIASVTIGARVYCGLVGHGGIGTDTAPTVGYVTRLPANNGGRLRFIGGYAR
jgi:hypothetical protein